MSGDGSSLNIRKASGAHQSTILQFFRPTAEQRRNTARSQHAALATDEQSSADVLPAITEISSGNTGSPLSPRGDQDTTQLNRKRDFERVFPDESRVTASERIRGNDKGIGPDDFKRSPEVHLTMSPGSPTSMTKRAKTDSQAIQPMDWSDEVAVSAITTSRLASGTFAFDKSDRDDSGNVTNEITHIMLCDIPPTSSLRVLSRLSRTILSRLSSSSTPSQPPFDPISHVFPNPPAPEQYATIDTWNSSALRMPFSRGNTTRERTWKWSAALDALRSPPSGWSPRDVTEAIRQATGRNWDLWGLEDALQEAESGDWGPEWVGITKEVMPWVIGCAATVGNAFNEGGVVVGNEPNTAISETGGSRGEDSAGGGAAQWKQGRIPMLREGRDLAVTLSQSQVLSLLSLAFLALFPRRNDLGAGSEYATFPSCNFHQLWRIPGDESREKIKCLLAYWKGTLRQVPTGAITFHRRFIPPSALPRWGTLFHTPLADMVLEVHIDGDIFGPEGSEGDALMVDFANKDVGGGVIARGAVQEEILFLTHPEFIAARLFTERLRDTECLFVTGAQRWSKIKGYGRGFQFDGKVGDAENCDALSRRARDIVAIDALPFTPSTQLDQYNLANLKRELNKAYVGFLPSPLLSGQPVNSIGPDGSVRKVYPAVSTGNWGCGAFLGDPEWKWAIQVMATRAAGRTAMRYFTFGDEDLADGMKNVFKALTANGVSVGTLYHWLCKYSEECVPTNRRTGRSFKSVFEFLIERTNSLREATVEPDEVVRQSSSSTIWTEEIESSAESEASKEFEALRDAELEEAEAVDGTVPLAASSVEAYAFTQQLTLSLEEST
ncbi:hypothetical protein M427DRAFT_500438 [Gonapodya prolifera JEL478]|uniref:poly(ADP-ribose) glycohydrolase n=1 Tax=Gonapodya prolifera (strain JEL478) TaxID=1344416 RepID=A0A139AAS6_GONPJ|nr:hypothetical protein M427DRAFT_500438 [Gonapodya prolifera JEL478]|eukprot:KXS13493.1 hypothetical protein M427DRAFT_500438 [Gonapodya prolifera JEL478]